MLNSSHAASLVEMNKDNATAILSNSNVKVEGGNNTTLSKNVTSSTSTGSASTSNVTTSKAVTGESVPAGAEPLDGTNDKRSIKGQPLFVFKPSQWIERPAAIYDHQISTWYGDWSGNPSAAISAQVTAAGNQLASITLYNIPGRDCGNYSAGGAASSAAYRAWIDGAVSGVGNRKAIIILEPDALTLTDCLSLSLRTERFANLSYAVNAFKSSTQASVYIDAGHSAWKPVDDIVSLLRQAGVASATGFAINVSNFQPTDASFSYGEQIANSLLQQGVPGVRYVVDTSRNGQGPDADWCNPLGRGLGKLPTTNSVAGSSLDAFLWIKTIGESDGTCNGGPAAGQWFPEYAQMLIANAVY